MVYLNLSDQLLLNHCSNHDELAFREIYRRYKKFVYAIVLARLNDAEEARDVTQDIFIALWNSRTQLENIAEFKAYLYVFSRNQVISAYRKKNIRIKGETYLIEGLTELDHSPEDHRLANELVIHINHTVGQLPETMRNCYHLSKNENRKNHEIAGILNISEKTVRNNVSEALKRLKLNLKQSHPELLLLMIIYCLPLYF